jgi:hypothetical protein
MQEIMPLMNKFASSSEGAMPENQGLLSMYELTFKGGKDQGALMKYSRGPRQKTGSSHDKTPYLDRRDNDV